MESIGLPATLRVFVQPPELPFPEGDPFLQGKAHIARSAEKMRMIGHEQIIADQPGLGRLPCGAQRRMNGAICQPGYSILRANGEKNNRGLVGINVNAASGMFAADFFVRTVVHGAKLPETSYHASKKSYSRWGESPLVSDFFPRSW